MDNRMNRGWVLGVRCWLCSCQPPTPSPEPPRAHMDRIDSKIRTNSSEFQANAAHMSALIGQLKEELAKVRLGGPEELRKRHKERGKLLARERIEALIDPNTPFLELSPLAAYGMYDNPLSAGIVTGIGLIQGRETVIVSN